MAKSQTKELPSRMSPEKELLLLSITPDLDLERKKKIEEIIKLPLDWQMVTKLASTHGITPLLYYNLKKIQLLDSLNPEVSSYLQDMYLYNLKRNITLWKELSFVLNLLKNEKIELLLFKGIILCLTVYPDPALRKFADIDAIIKENDLPIIREILKNRGYVEKKQISSFLFTQEINQDISLYLELHTKLKPLRPYEVKIDELWQRSKEKDIFGSQVRFPSWEDTFILLCLHIKKHSHCMSLRFICDIAWVLNSYGDKLNWDYVQKITVKNHISNNIYFCLYLSNEILGIPLPPLVLERFNPPLFYKKSIRYLVNKNNFFELPLWRGYLLRVILLDRLTDFFVYLKKIIFAKRVAE